MRFTLGLSMAVITLGLFAVVLNLNSPGLMMISLLGIGFAIVPIILLRWVGRMGMSPHGVRWTRSQGNGHPPRGDH